MLRRGIGGEGKYPPRKVRAVLTPGCFKEQDSDHNTRGSDCENGQHPTSEEDSDDSSGVDNDDVENDLRSSARKNYETREIKRLKKRKEKMAKLGNVEKAFREYSSGRYKNLSKCAKATGVSYMSLYRVVTGDGVARVQGRPVKGLSISDEDLIKRHLVWRAEHGC